MDVFPLSQKHVQNAELSRYYLHFLQTLSQPLLYRLISASRLFDKFSISIKCTRSKGASIFFPTIIFRWQCVSISIILLPAKPKIFFLKNKVSSRKEIITNLKCTHLFYYTIIIIQKNYKKHYLKALFLDKD